MNENNKIYFLNCFRNYVNNANKEFSRKYSPSIRELLNDYIELYDDMLKATDNDKLKKSHNAQLNVIEVFLTKSIFYKSVYKRDLINLVKKIKDYKKNAEEKNNNYLQSNSIYNICTSLLKTLNQSNLYEEIVNIIYESSKYIEFDNCVETLINELSYDGYSLVYIRAWYINIVELCKTKTGFDYDVFIRNISDLKRHKRLYNIYLTIKNDEKYIEEWFIDSNLQMKFVDKGNLEESIQKHLQFNNMDRAVMLSIESMDGYGAVFNVINSFKSYFLIVNLINSRNSYSVNDKITYEDKDNGKIFNINVQANDSQIVLPNIDNREKYDLHDFLRYRKGVYEKNITTGEITSIERCLNILKDNNSENEENRLIELWSVLEYLLSYYSGNSIISKAKEIIPQIMCLYLLKDKLNIFWSVLQNSRNRDEEADRFIKESLLDGDTEKYDIKKLLENIEKYKDTLIDKFGYNSKILNRKYCELGSIISKEIDLAKNIEEVHNMIEADVIRIYRTRNIVVHSGNSTRTNVLLKNARLMQYISNLIGVILHYKMKNNEHTIKEILYAIPETYNEYLEDLKAFKKSKDIDINELEEIFKPHYLFL